MVTAVGRRWADDTFSGTLSDLEYGDLREISLALHTHYNEVARRPVGSLSDIDRHLERLAKIRELLRAVERCQGADADGMIPEPYPAEIDLTTHELLGVGPAAGRGLGAHLPD